MSAPTPRRSHSSVPNVRVASQDAIFFCVISKSCTTPLLPLLGHATAASLPAVLVLAKAVRARIALLAPMGLVPLVPLPP